MDKKRSLFFDTSLIYFIVIALFVVLRIFSSLVPTSAMGKNLLGVLIQVGFMLLVPFFMYKFLRKKKTTQILQDFNVKKISFKAVLITIGIGIVVYFLNLAVASFFNIFIFASGYDPSFGMASNSGGEYTLLAFLGDIIITAILPGICEEFCHRGLLVNGYKQLKPKKTILLVGFLFGLMHLNIEQFFYATVIGFFLTFLVYLTDSIIPAIIVHFLNNAIGLYMAFAEANNLPFGDFTTRLANILTGSPIAVMGTVLLIVILLLGSLLFLVYLLLKQTKVKELQSLAKKAVENQDRLELLKSFDIDTSDDNVSQNGTTVEVKSFMNNGYKNYRFDFTFSENSLMSVKGKSPSLKDKTFLIGTIIIGIIITISTLIWGII